MFTYSFKDLVGAFAHPDAGVFQFYGEAGIDRVTITMATERTTHQVASDGAVQVTYRAGDNGHATIETQQTSPLHAFLVNWANILQTNADIGNLTNYAAATIKLVSVLNGATHSLTGVSPSKQPDKPYGAEGANVTWTLLAANIVNEAILP